MFEPAKKKRGTDEEADRYVLDACLHPRLAGLHECLLEGLVGLVEVRFDSPPPEQDSERQGVWANLEQGSLRESSSKDHATDLRDRQSAT